MYYPKIMILRIIFKDPVVLIGLFQSQSLTVRTQSQGGNVRVLYKNDSIVMLKIYNQLKRSLWHASKTYKKIDAIKKRRSVRQLNKGYRKKDIEDIPLELSLKRTWLPIDSGGGLPLSRA